MIFDLCILSLTIEELPVVHGDSYDPPDKVEVLKMLRIGHLRVGVHLEGVLGPGKITLLFIQSVFFISRFCSAPLIIPEQPTHREHSIVIKSGPID